MMDQELVMERPVMSCTECGFNCTPGSRFCPECGAKLAPPTCLRCRAELIASARFCAQCGAPSPLDATSSPTASLQDSCALDEFPPLFRHAADRIYGNATDSSPVTDPPSTTPPAPQPPRDFNVGAPPHRACESGPTVPLPHETESTRALGPAPTIKDGAHVAEERVVVSCGGQGHFRTINQAISSVPPRTTIAIAPGRYEEVLTIDRPVTLVGTQRRDDVWIEYPEVLPEDWYDGAPVIGVESRGVTIQGLSVVGRVAVSGFAELDVSDCSINTEECGGACLASSKQATTVVRSCELLGKECVMVRGKSLLEDCTLLYTIDGHGFGSYSTIHVEDAPAHLTMRRCTIDSPSTSVIGDAMFEDCVFTDGGIGVSSGGQLVILRSRISGGSCGIALGLWDAAKSRLTRLTVQQCDILSVDGEGILVEDNPVVTNTNVKIDITSSRINGNLVAIALNGRTGNVRVENCDLTGNKQGSWRIYRLAPKVAAFNNLEQPPVSPGGLLGPRHKP